MQQTYRIKQKIEALLVLFIVKKKSVLFAGLLKENFSNLDLL
jgi:hypothetical protein